MVNDNILLLEMTKYYQNDPQRAQHFIKVYSYAKWMGQSEGVSSETLHILCTAAIVHDIGIRAAEEKYHHSNGALQEQEGPPLARAMLSRLSYSPSVIDRVCFLVGHHHTYNSIDGMDYQLLIEADFLVNMYEDNMDSAAIRHAYDTIFVTNTGKAICRAMFADAF